METMDKHVCVDSYQLLHCVYKDVVNFGNNHSVHLTDNWFEHDDV